MRRLSQASASGSRQGGFTLIELLMAITLMAIIMTLAYQGLRAGTRAVSSGEDLVDRTNRLRIVQQFVRNQVSRMLPLALKSEQGDEDSLDVVLFEGSDDTMRFVAPMPGYLSRGGPHEQVLALRPGPAGQELLFAFRLLGSFDDGDALEDGDIPPTVLLEGIRRGQFEYLTVDDEGEPTEWLGEWEDGSATPLLVRLDFEMTDGSRLHWPTMEIAPLLDGTAVRSPNRGNVIPNQPNRVRDPERPVRRTTDL